MYYTINNKIIYMTVTHTDMMYMMIYLMYMMYMMIVDDVVMTVTLQLVI